VAVTLLFSALVSQCQGAKAPTKDHKMSLMSINPPLEDVASDKKFFGPPFPADYPEDKRPHIKKSIMDSVRSPGEPYPALQAPQDFDVDFVKDENSDTGAWKAQFEYDEARKRLMDAEGDEKRAQGEADEAGRGMNDAERDAAGAAKDSGAAQKDLDDAKAGEDAANRADATRESKETVITGDETLEELKRKVKEAEENYAKQKAAFAECERQLKEAKEKFEKLKAELEALEAKTQGNAKLWVEQRTVRMNALKEKKEAEKTAAQAKTKAAEEVLAKAKAAQAEFDKKLAKEKGEHAAALQRLQKEKADLDKAHKGLEDARTRLQALRGHAPPAHSPKSGSCMTSVMFALLLAIAHLML